MTDTHKQESMSALEFYNDVWEAALPGANVEEIKKSLTFAEAYAAPKDREIARLKEALQPYVHCRHACIECFCTKEARAALQPIPEKEPK